MAGARQGEADLGRTDAEDCDHAKAKGILAELDRGSQPLGKTKLEEVLDAYLRWGSENWADNQRVLATRELKKMLAPCSSRKADTVDLRMLRTICNAASTANVARARRSHLRSFLKWGKGQDYFRPDQVDLLDEYTYVPDTAPVRKPLRRPKSRTNAEAATYVTPDEVPLHGALVTLGNALQERLPYGRLLVELAASSGLRIGELFALDVDHVLPARRQLFVEWQALAVRNRDGGRLGPPKNEKTRMAVFPEKSATGYPLADELATRLEEVEREHQAGNNPHRLILSAKRGGYWWSTSFTNDEFTPAALKAGWERLSWVEAGETRYQWRHTMHSLRHRFAHDAIEQWSFTPAELTAVGGWESIAVVFARYYGQSADLLEQVYRKTSS
jgi:integrase